MDRRATVTVTVTALISLSALDFSPRRGRRRPPWKAAPTSDMRHISRYLGVLDPGQRKPRTHNTILNIMTGGHPTCPGSNRCPRTRSICPVNSRRRHMDTHMRRLGRRWRHRRSSLERDQCTVGISRWASSVPSLTSRRILRLTRGRMLD